jgi:HEAT repeat protein
LNADLLATEIERLGTDDDAVDLVRRMRGLNYEPLLWELLRNKSATVRGWTLWAATELLGTRSVPFLRAGLKDRDSDVRDDALARLVQLDPRQALYELPRLRKMLRSRDDYEVAAALWSLAELGDERSVPEIEGIVRSPRVPWLEKPASVALLLIEGRTPEILEAIRGHDHRRMKELAHAAAILRTPDAIAALRQGSDADTDRECRGWCKWFLAWASNRPRRYNSEV